MKTKLIVSLTALIVLVMSAIPASAHGTSWSTSAYFGTPSGGNMATNVVYESNQSHSQLHVVIFVYKRAPGSSQWTLLSGSPVECFTSNRASLFCASQVTSYQCTYDYKIYGIGDAYGAQYGWHNLDTDTKIKQETC